MRAQLAFSVNMGRVKTMSFNEIALNDVSELTPISLDEAKKLVGESPQYSSGESLATAVLDFTAIARAYLRNIPKFEVLNIAQVRYN